MTKRSKDGAEEKLKRIEKEMKERGRIIVAFSGGVDSSVVAKIAHESAGKKALAVIADSETLPRAELEAAIRTAKEIGIPVRVIRFSELDSEEFKKNPPNRCYYCRKGLAEALKRIAASKKIDTIADGVNLSDLDEHRPGIRAADEEGIWHPFIDFRVTKEEVRRIAGILGLSVSRKPSAACMASRIPYGERITRKKLDMVERGEELLKGLGFLQVRVRAHKEIARIEVPRSEITKFLERDTSGLIRQFKAIGFKYITLDLEGYRTGSMDEVL